MRSSPRHRPSVLLGTAIAVLASGAGTPFASSGAQEIRGVAHIAGVGTPLVDASVVLLSASGSVVAGTITNTNGSYVLRAPRQGTYRVRARHIGFSPDSSRALELVAGQAATFSPKLTPFATQLTAVRVDAASRCAIAPEAGATAHRLWEEAQSALTAAAVESENAQIGFALRRFERELDPSGSVVRKSKSWDSRAVSSEPYASVAAESLAVHGFIVPEGQYLVYYAPDVRTLTSDPFARAHCFRPVQDQTRPDLIGLAFAPAKNATERSRNGPATRDVSGTLWLDRASAQLRFLEFEYGAAPAHTTDGATAGAAAANASGRVDYQRLPSGPWIVNHWVIRMPVVITRTVMAPVGTSSIEEGAILSRTEASNVVAIWQAGGDVIGTFPVSDMAASVASSFGAVSGRFVDSTERSSAHRGVPGVRVRLTPVGADHATDREVAQAAVRAAVTDTAGTFTIDSIPQGDYLVDASAPSLDALGVEIAQRKVHVTAGTMQSLLTVVPPESSAIALLCPSGLSSDEVALHGLVRNMRGGEAVPGARVTVSWFNIADSRQDHFVAGTQSLATLANREGEYVICGLPLARQVLVTASTGTRKSVPLPLDPSHRRIRLANIVIAREAAARAPADVNTATGSLITGTVRDTTGHAIRMAAVRLDSLAWRAVTETGTFTFTDVPAGRHVLETRALGFNPHAWYVTVRPDHSSVAPLTLERVTLLEGVQVVARADTSRLDPTGFTERRLRNSGGSYIDQKQIEQRGAQRMTDVLLSLPGVALLPVSNEYGSRDYVLVMRGVATAQGENCPIQYYLDGQPFAQSDNIDRLISPREVSAVEVYAGASQVPPQFKGPTSRCGVIAIWTKISGA